MIPLPLSAGAVKMILVSPGRSQIASTLELKYARQRQELKMRWILLATVVIGALLSSLCAVLYGPSLPFAAAQATWAGLLAWIVRRLFSR